MNYEYRLYEINIKLASLLESAVDPETGELTIDPAELDMLDMEREELLEDIALEVKNKLAYAAAVKYEIEALTNRMKQAEASAKRLKEQLGKYLNGEPMKTARVNVSYRHSVSTDIDCEAFFADENNKRFWIYPNPTADKNAVKKALNAGENVIGAKLTENVSIQIK